MASDWLDNLRKAWSSRTAARRERDRMRLGAASADLARRQFRWAEAAEGYGRYLASRPTDTAIVVRLMHTLIAAGRIGEARDVLEAGVARRPRSPALTRARIELAAAETRTRGETIDWDSHEVPPPPASSRHRPGTVLRSGPGVGLRPEAKAWLEYVLVSTGAAAVYADHLMRPEAEDGDVAPVLHGAAHAEDLATTPWPPVMAMFSGAAVPPADIDIRLALMKAFDIGPVVHLPLVLAEAPWVPREESPLSPVPQEAAPASRILALVPTRDEGVMLEAMIDSLRATAARPDLVDILVIDNGSREPATLSLLDGWETTGSAEVLRIDEPFNWSDLNNRAAAGRSQELLLFVNNDMVMRTVGWDVRLRAHLARPAIGVVGARMLYPAGNLQHAGLALGVGEADGSPGGPLHEGLGAGAADPGPLDRWVRTRPAAAVTGAFLAVRREVFEAVGGFDAANFPVSCNDVDFCLKVRERGLTVLYAADVELTHDESHTRGHDDSEARRSRAEAEKAALVRLWGEDALRDPSRNPHWIADGARIFHHLRGPDRETALGWIARRHVWRVSARDRSGGASLPVSRRPERDRPA